MADEIIVNGDTSNTNPDDTVKVDDTTKDVDLDNPADTDDVEVLKQRNQSLYERMKKAEGFARNDEGKWIKKPKPVVETKFEAKSSGKSAQSSDIDKMLDEKLEKRELESLDLSDELKKEVQNYARLNNVSVKKALSSEYIVFRKEKEEKKERIDDASVGKGRKSTTKKDYSQKSPKDFDLRTPEGKAEWSEYQNWLKSQG